MMEPTYEIMYFRCKWEAEYYRRNCGIKGTAVRMLHRPGHRYANERGNVPVIYCGDICGNRQYLFSDGYVRIASLEGL